MKKIEFEGKVVINKPVDITFGYVSNFENHKKIFKANIDCRMISEGRISVGSKVSVFASFLGLKMQEYFEITEFQKNEKIGKKTILGSTHPSEDEFTFKTVGNAQTEVRLNIVSWPSGAFKLAAPLVQRLFVKAVSRDLMNLKHLVESL